MKQKFRIAILVVCLLILPLSACRRSTPPALETIYDEAVSLIEASYAVNDIVFGHGLPVYRIGSEYAERYHLYDDNDYADYEYVTEKSPYRSIAEIQDALERVYSTDYLNSLYTGLFSGFTTETGIVRAQYYEKNNQLYQSVGYEPLVTWQRIYDYSTLRIVKPSEATRVTLELESHTEQEQNPLTVRLVLVLEENGWRLDTPTY